MDASNRAIEVRKRNYVSCDRLHKNLGIISVDLCKNVDYTNLVSDSARLETSEIYEQRNDVIYEAFLEELKYRRIDGIWKSHLPDQDFELAVKEISKAFDRDERVHKLYDYLCYQQERKASQITDKLRATSTQFVYLNDKYSIDFLSADNIKNLTIGYYTRCRFHSGNYEPGYMSKLVEASYEHPDVCGFVAIYDKNKEIVSHSFWYENISDKRKLMLHSLENSSRAQDLSTDDKTKMFDLEHLFETGIKQYISNNKDGISDIVITGGSYYSKWNCEDNPIVKSIIPPVISEIITYTPKNN